MRLATPKSRPFAASCSDERININFGPAYAGDLAISKGTLYVLSGLTGGTTPFYVVDVSDPQNPSFSKAYCDKFQHNEPESLLVYRDFLILDDYYSIHIYSIKDKINPEYIESTPTGGVASWSLGNIRGSNLYYPTLDGLKSAALPAVNEGLKGTVAVQANFE